MPKIEETQFTVRGRFVHASGSTAAAMVRLIELDRGRPPTILAEQEASAEGNFEFVFTAAQAGGSREGDAEVVAVVFKAGGIELARSPMMSVKPGTSADFGDIAVKSASPPQPSCAAPRRSGRG